MFCSLETGMNRNLLWKDGTVTEKVVGSEVVINWQTRLWNGLLWVHWQLGCTALRFRVISTERCFVLVFLTADTGGSM